MLEALSKSKFLLAIMIALGLLVLGTVALQAEEPIKLHVLFTGEVGGQVEPSG